MSDIHLTGKENRHQEMVRCRVFHGYKMWVMCKSWGQCKQKGSLHLKLESESWD